MKTGLTLYKLNVFNEDVYCIEISHREITGVYYYSQLSDAIEKIIHFYITIPDLEIVNERLFDNNLNEYFTECGGYFSNIRNKQIYSTPLYSGKEIK